MTLLVDTQSAIHHPFNNATSVEVDGDLAGQKEPNSSILETTINNLEDSVISQNISSSSSDEVAYLHVSSTTNDEHSRKPLEFTSDSLNEKSEKQQVVKNNDYENTNGKEVVIKEKQQQQLKHNEISSQQAQRNYHHHHHPKPLDSNLSQTINLGSESVPQRPTKSSTSCAVASSPRDTLKSNAKYSTTAAENEQPLAYDYLPAHFPPYTSTAIFPVQAAAAPATHDSRLLTETAINFNNGFHVPVYSQPGATLQPAIYTAAVPSVADHPHHPTSALMIHPFDHNRQTAHFFAPVEHVQQQAAPIYYYHKYPTYQPSPIKMATFYSPAAPILPSVSNFSHQELAIVESNSESRACKPPTTCSCADSLTYTQHALEQQHSPATSVASNKPLDSDDTLVSQKDQDIGNRDVDDDKYDDAIASDDSQADKQEAYRSLNLARSNKLASHSLSLAFSQRQQEQAQAKQLSPIETCCLSKKNTNTSSLPHSVTAHPIASPSCSAQKLESPSLSSSSSSSFSSSSPSSPSSSSSVCSKYSASLTSMGNLNNVTLDRDTQQQQQQHSSTANINNQERQQPTLKEQNHGNNVENFRFNKLPLGSPSNSSSNCFGYHPDINQTSVDLPNPSVHQLPQQQYYNSNSINLHPYHQASQYNCYVADRQQYYTSTFAHSPLVAHYVPGSGQQQQQQLLLFQPAPLPNTYPPMQSYYHLHGQQELTRAMGSPAMSHYEYALNPPAAAASMSMRSQYYASQHPTYQPYIPPTMIARYSAPTFREQQQQLLCHQPMTMVSEPSQQLVSPPQLLGPYQQQFYYYNNYQLPYKTVAFADSHVSNEIINSNRPADYNPIALLPIDAQPTCTRQAYGMDKVWRDEFGHIFSQLVPDIYWTLAEVETNPSIRESASIIAYKGRYIVVATYNSSGSKSEQGNEDSQEKRQELNEDKQGWVDTADREEADDESHSLDDSSSSSGSGSSCKINNHTSSLLKSGESQSKEESPNDASLVELESDCDSGAHIDSASGSISTVTNETSLNSQQGVSSSPGVRKFPTRFRMFIDSAKVRFCCDLCGHGWTSMKGRVVFWYELFELVDESQSHHYLDDEDNIPASSNLIGYCAYKLFGQQCDICKIENRFERPMWYPEEVTKVLHNLYNKIGQVYFGFKMPTIDKQRRAGKPKTSHNSSLCQACHDGVCTDRK